MVVQQCFKVRQGVTVSLIFAVTTDELLNCRFSVEAEKYSPLYRKLRGPLCFCCE